MTKKTAFVQKSSSDKSLTIIDGNKYSAGVVVPIISEGDTIGSVVILKDSGEKTMGETEEKLAKAGAMFLAKQMEI